MSPDVYERFKQAVKDAGEPTLYDWLPSNFSDAFVICVGAGPWKYARRREVQTEAIRRLDAHEIHEVTGEVDWYPLEWQNTFVENLGRYLRSGGETMYGFCQNLIRRAKRHPYDSKVVETLYHAVGCRRSKVLSLFARDRLKIASFPIDRHVNRWLKKYDLPNKEFELLHLCARTGLDARKVATAFVQTGLDVGNADFRG